MALLAVAIYHGLRALAAGCVGGGCDAYIPVSLLLPLAALALSCVTGLVAVAESRGSWRGLTGGATLLSVLGPIAALLVLRDHPDLFILVATILVVLAPIAALVYSLPARSR